MKRHHRHVRAAALALALAAVTSPAAFAQQDLRSPDARDAARPAVAQQDLRSPDARDAARPAAAQQDLRSPDARDAAIGYRPGGIAARLSLPPAHRPVAASSDHIDWRDAGGLVALMMLACAGAIVLMRRRTGGRLVAALTDGTRDWRRAAGL